MTGETPAPAAVVYDIGNHAEMQQHQGGGGMKMSVKAGFCLGQLSRRPMCRIDLAHWAAYVGINGNVYPCDWAYTPLRELRNLGFARKLTKKSAHGQFLHEITDKGRAALKEMAE